MQLAMWRRTVALAVVGILGWLAVSGPAVAAVSAPDASSEAGFASRVQYERTSRGLAGLTETADLVAVARRHANDMASQQRLFDDPNLGQEVQSWQAVGENSGTGGSVDQVHAAFMASAPHRSIILNPSFTQIGVGVVWTGGQLWVAEIFRQPSRAPQSAAAPPPPPATPPPAPTPAPRVAPTAAPPPAPPHASVRPAAVPVSATPAPIVAQVVSTPTTLPVTPIAAPVAEARVLAASTFRPPHHVGRNLLPLTASVAILLLGVDGGLLGKVRRRRYTRIRSASRS